MAIGTPTSIGSAQDIVNDATISLTVSAAVAAGQKVIVCGQASGGPGTTATFADSKGNTYATDATSNVRANGQSYIASAQITNALTTSDTITMTVSASQTAKIVAAVQVSGLLTTSAKDQSVVANGTVVGWSTGASPATTQADELVIAACGNDSTATETSTAGATYSELFDISTSSAAELTVIYKIVAGTGAQTGSGTWTNSGARGWNAALVTYKAAAGGGGGAVQQNLTLMGVGS